MACYVCGNSGHKRGNCPERIMKIKCHECGNLGHYKNDCPITKEKIRNERLLQEKEIIFQQEQKLSQQKIDDEKWFNDNISAESEKLVNELDIKNVLTNTLSRIFYLNTINNEKFSIYSYKNKLSCYNSNALGRFINNMLIDDFMLFCSKWVIFSNISYDITNDDLSSIIYELNEANIASKIETEKDREVEYVLCKKKVMRSRRHSTDWRSRVHIEYKDLILDEYSKYKNGGPYQDNIHKFKGEINFIYQ
jgi:hypothetical protein